jgi:hypothetical protein
VNRVWLAASRLAVLHVPTALVAAVLNHETRYANCDQSRQLVLYSS